MMSSEKAPNTSKAKLPQLQVTRDDVQITEDGKVVISNADFREYVKAALDVEEGGFEALIINNVC